MLFAGLIEELFRLRMTSIATSAVVAVNSTLQRLSPAHPSDTGGAAITHHSKAPNTHAACADLQAFPVQASSLLR